MKKKIIITILAVFSLLLGSGLITNAEFPTDCPTCKEDDYCDKHDPTQGYACNTGGDGQLCGMVYVCP